MYEHIWFGRQNRIPEHGSCWKSSPSTIWASLLQCSKLQSRRVRSTKGRGRCSLCHKEGVHVFELGIGDSVVTHCPVCNSERALDAHSRAGRVCETCEDRLEFPDLGRSAVLTCYACLRAGRAAMTKDTELGMIRNTKTRCAGSLTVSLDLDRVDFELVPKGDGWVGVRLPPPVMLELLANSQVIPPFKARDGFSAAPPR